MHDIPWSDVPRATRALDISQIFAALAWRAPCLTPKPLVTSSRTAFVLTPRALATMMLCAVLVPARLLADAPSIYYVYDVLNRLVAVVDQDGNAATYTYDAVGNILRIDRFDSTGVPGAVAISLFTPSAGATGATVEIFGRGFGATTTQNSVFFAGRASEILAAASNRLVARVPASATTGPISVTTPSGAAVSSRAFRVLGQLSVAPASATVRVGGHVAFAATEAGSPVTAVRWDVNRLPGGDARSGTVTADGVYTAPTTVPLPSTVTITATSQDDPSLSASANVAIIPALSLLVWSRPVSVVGAAPALSLDRSIATAITVVREAPRGVTLALGRSISVALEPVVLSVVPSTAAAGGPAFSLRVVGRGFGAATSLVFLRNNAADSNVTIANLTVNADGTEATAEVTIAAAAASGARVVQIATPGHVSSPAGTVGNVFTVQ